ncbi:replication endonuclease [Campylobacterota bacterium DY0563]
MYGISDTDIVEIDNKIDFQKEYIKKFVSNFEEEDKDFLKSVYSASLNPKKYFAEINNRVNTLVSNAKEKGYLPVFVTLTLPSYYHKKNDEGFLCVSPNESSRVLSHVWAKFLRLKVFEHLKKDYNESMQYFRVYEPHKSGVPHLHALLFLPAEYILKVKDRFYSYFMDTKTWGKKKNSNDDIGSLNIGGLGFRYTWYKEKGGAVGYVMKYILKTFKDSNSKEIQHCVYWYVKNRIIRFLSSRSLVPLSVYRKVRYYFKNTFGINSLKEVTRLFKEGYINRYFNNTLITFSFYSTELDEFEEIIIWEKDPELQIVSKIASQNDFAYDLVQKRKHLKMKRNIIEFSNELIEKLVPISKLSDIKLFEKYINLNNSPISSYDTNHFVLVHNELVKRNLINKIPLQFIYDDEF